MAVWQLTAKPAALTTVSAAMAIGPVESCDSRQVLHCFSGRVPTGAIVFKACGRYLPDQANHDRKILDFRYGVTLY